VCPNWLTATDFAVPGSLAQDGESVYAVGTSSDLDGRPAEAELLPAHVCNGDPEQGVLPFGGASSAGAVAAMDQKVWVAGFSEADPAPVAALLTFQANLSGAPTTTPFSGSAAPNALHAIAVGGTGVWLAGSSADASGAATPWLGHVPDGETPCAVALDGAGEARAVATDDAGAVVVVDRTDGAELQRFDAAGCSPPSCSCQPAFVSQKLVAASTSQIVAEGVTLVGQTALVAGFAAPPGSDPFGILIAVDVTNGKVTGFARLDPGPNVDALFAVGSDGTRVYAGGTTGAAAFDDLGSGTGTLAAYLLPLGDDAQPEWSSPFFDGSRVVSIVASDSGVFGLAARVGGGAQIGRCLPDGC
jgi:hypothetical protein